MSRAEPERVEYCQLNGKVLNEFPYDCWLGTSFGDCLALVQKCLSTYWRKEGHTVRPMHKIKPLPELVRVVAEDGAEICRWSVCDMEAH